LPPVLGSGRKKSVIDDSSTNNKAIRLSYLTEQTSHHPPVSAFWIDCPEKGIYARGFDQISAKFTGTSIKVTPGAHNLGIFITLTGRDNEEYQLTHPAAHLGGLLKGTLSVTVADTCFITCPKSRLKAILLYLDEGWIGKNQNKVVGVIYRYDPENDTISKPKDVPEKDVVARVEGSWQNKVYFTTGGDQKEKKLLIDLVPLFPVPKTIPPIAEQLPNESLRFWSDVTEAILDKEFNKATKLKHDIEERQREKAVERKENNEEWQPRFFTGVVTPIGRPDLTDEGKAVLKGLGENNFSLKENNKLGA